MLTNKTERATPRNRLAPTEQCKYATLFRARPYDITGGRVNRINIYIYICGYVRWYLRRGEEIPRNERISGANNGDATKEKDRVEVEEVEQDTVVTNERKDRFMVNEKNRVRAKTHRWFYSFKHTLVAKVVFLFARSSFDRVRVINANISAEIPKTYIK